jgi:hypothetical protein
MRLAFLHRAARSHRSPHHRFGAGSRRRAEHPLGAALGGDADKRPVMDEFGAASAASGNIRGVTNTLPLQIELLYQDYDDAGASPLRAFSRRSRWSRSSPSWWWSAREPDATRGGAG